MRALRKASPTISDYPSMTTRELSVLAWRVRSRIESVQMAAFELGTLLCRKQSETRLLCADLTDATATAEVTLRSRLEHYMLVYVYSNEGLPVSKNDPVFHLLSDQEYKVHERNLICAVLHAAELCAFFQSFDLSNVALSMRVEALRDLLDDVCAFAEKMIDNLRSRGFVDNDDEAA